MPSLLSSLARLADGAAVSLLVLHVSRHLGQRYADRVARDTRVLGEEERLCVVPLIFGLLPRSAIVRARYDMPIKPLLARHLEQLGLVPTSDLLDVLKSVADQYHRTAPGPNRPRKWGIADLKASDPRLYRDILARQLGRCIYCGLAFDGNEEETLDHIIPWRLVGDVGDGTNWQIICRPCNVGKSNILSSLQAIKSLNWIYREELGGDTSNVSLRTRFVLLARDSRCSEVGCGQSTQTARLHVVPQVFPRSPADRRPSPGGL